MTEQPRRLIPRPVLTAEQAERRDVFLTACMTLDEYEPGWVDVFIARGIVPNRAGWNKLKDNELHWVARNCDPATGDPVRLDALWLLVEERHAALRAAPAASSHPRQETP